MLLKCAATALNSKLLASHKEMFAQIAVDAVLHLDQDLDISMIGIKKESGGALEDSQLVEGVAFKKTFSYAGFEQQPKKFVEPKILLLNLELELKAEKENAELRIESAKDYQAMIDAEWDIIYEKLDRIVKSGAKVVLSRLAIGDLATQYFADRGVFCAGRVPEEDLRRVARACGAQVQTSVTGELPPSVLGTCGLFEERQVGSERYNFFSGCRQARAVTILLRGGGEQFNEEAERSLHDAIMIVRRALRHNTVVAGGGAIEMQVSRALREHARSVAGKQQPVIQAVARALEVIPRQLAMNAGLDATHLLNKLRQKHATAPAGRPCWFGIDINNEDICDTFEAGVWEPALVKLNAIQAATEAACQILSVDETVKNPKSDSNLPGENAPAPVPRGRGTPGRGGMRRGR
jgi:T-complex protein 1 subunit eta